VVTRQGGSTHIDRPVFNTVADAVKATAPTYHLFVPRFAADAIMEAAEAGIALVCVSPKAFPYRIW